jgi:hypothetical protein
MTTYIGRGGLATTLRIKLTEVFYVPRVWQWFSILRSQANATRVADLDHPEGSLIAGGELVGTVLSEHPLEQKFIHLELSATHEPLLIASERLVVPCIFNRRLSSSFVAKVNIFAPKLVLCGFVVCLDMEGAHGDLREEDGLNHVHQKERSFFGGPTG